MKYIINCDYCEKEIVVEGTDDDEGVKNMKEEARSHNSLRHPEEALVPDEELTEKIQNKWRKES